MRLLTVKKALLLAVAAFLVVSGSPSQAVHSMFPNFFRRKWNQAKDRLQWMRPRKHLPTSDIAAINSLEEFAIRLNSFGFKGHRGANEIFSIFQSLKDCFRSFAPPAGLALNFSPESALNNDEAIRNLFIFTPPSQLLYDPMQPRPTQTSFVEMNEDDADTPAFVETPAEVVAQPLRTVKSARDAKTILATIIRNVYNHLQSPTCQMVGKKRDGRLFRFLLRKNSTASIMDSLLIFSLLQGNAASAGYFPAPAAPTSTIDNIETFKAPANASTNPGIYDPSLIVAFYDLVRESDGRHMKKLERLLAKPVNEMTVGAKLFGNSLANPVTHANITALGNAVGTDEALLRKIVESIGHMAMDTGDAASILLPKLPRVASFVRGVSFFAFEEAFQQHGPYVIPGLPCGDNIEGNMVETTTGKNLGSSYYVYKFMRPLAQTELSDDVWTPNPESPVAQYLKNTHKSGGDYLAAHLPRVCVRIALFDKCAKRPPARTETNEERLCHFINKHQTLFFKVDGKGVYEMRNTMAMTVPRRGLRHALSRGFMRIRKFLFNRKSAALLMGTAVGALCVALGLVSVVGGSMCAVGAAGAAAFLPKIYAVSPFFVKPAITLGLGQFLSANFERNLHLTKTMIGLSDGPSQDVVV